MAYTRAELEREFEAYQRRGEEAAKTQDWNPWAEQFTEDATYVEHLYGAFQGREAIRRWITKTMTRFPGNAMPAFPIEWYMIDEERGWIACQVWNRMEDPGDGSVHQSYNLTKLHYAGDGLWSFEEDAYNPTNFMSMIDGWCKKADELGTLSDDARRWLELVRAAG